MRKHSNDLLSRFETHLRDRAFLKPRQKILIACSGGPDSTAIFHLLRGLAGKYSWKLGLVHFNHRLRPGAAEKDEQFVRDLARKFQSPFYAGTGNVRREAGRTKTSIEECARRMRYDFFLKTAQAKKYRTVVLAHTRDDQAETVLMRVLQGTGMRGLQGIRETFSAGRVAWVRPLLVFNKEELLKFLHAEKLKFRKDRSNGSVRFLRNRIRLELLPRLRRDFNPRIAEALSRIPAIVADEGALIAELEKKAWEKIFKEKRGKKVKLRRSVFLRFHPALQFRIIEKALKKIDAQSGLSFEAWERIRRGLARPRGCWSLPRDIDLLLTVRSLTVYRKR